MIFQWYEVINDALFELGKGFFLFLPKIIGAIIVFLIGWVLAIALGKIVSEVLKRIRFNQIFESANWKEVLEKTEIKVDPSSFIGSIVKWVLVIVFLLASVEILGFIQFSIFLNDVLDFVPNVIVAALILVVTVIIVDIVEKILRSWVESTKVGYGQLVTTIVKWSIWIFAVVAILNELGIASDLLQTLFTGIVGLLVIAGGLAFGLGGKDYAREILENLKNNFKK